MGTSEDLAKDRVTTGNKLKEKRETKNKQMFILKKKKKIVILEFQVKVLKPIYNLSINLVKILTMHYRSL